MKKLSLLLILTLVLGFSMTLRASSRDYFISARDSILRQLDDKSRNPRELIADLYNLSDVGLSLDTLCYTRRLWQEAVNQHDADAIISSGSSIIRYYLKIPRLDSADVWIDRCREHFIGPERHAALIYLSMLREIRDMGDRTLLASRLLKQNVTIRKNQDPYETLKMLYELGVLALEDWSGNTTIQMKPWDSYMEEGWEIARSLPLKESYSFRLQYLIALSTMSVERSRQLLELQQQYLAQPEMKLRSFYSHRVEIMTCARMLSHSEQLTREQLDSYFSQFTSLVRRYPFDSPADVRFYYNDVAIKYYAAIKDPENLISCCDSGIRYAPMFKLDNSYYYEMRAEALYDLKQFDRAYLAMRECMQVKDSLQTAGTADQLMELQTQYDVDRLSYESESRRIMLLLAAVICLVLLFGLALLIYHYRLVRKKNAALYHQISEYLDREQQPVQPSEQAQEISASQQIFEGINRLIESNPQLLSDSELNRETLARHLNTNYTYIQNAVREFADDTVSGYLNRLRVKKIARQIKSEPDVPLENIRMDWGFASRSTFFRFFKQEFGLSPSEFRAEVLK